MTIFYIQTDEFGIPLFDFGYTLIKSLEYHNWLNNNDFDWIPSNHWKIEQLKDLRNIDSYVPIGSIEFVNSFLDQLYYEGASKLLKPYYPPFLKDYYLGGFAIDKPIHYIKGKSDDEQVHIKNTNTLKHPLNGNYTVKEIKDKAEQLGDDFYICQSDCSSMIKSEWRCFVHKDQLKDCRCYSGDQFIIPYKKVIDDIVCKISKAPTKIPAYTLDVCVTNDKQTKIVELHNFYSCGLYGFQNYRELPYMFTQQWYNMLNFVKEQK